MNIFHAEIEDKWNSYNIFEQYSNIGAELGRAINWKKKNNLPRSTNALYRALELIDFTVADKKNKNSLKEILRMREIFLDYFLGDNIYQSTDESWDKYFYPYNYAARNSK